MMIFILTPRFEEPHKYQKKYVPYTLSHVPRWLVCRWNGTSFFRYASYLAPCYEDHVALTIPRHSEPTRLLLCTVVGRERILRLVRSKPQYLLAPKGPVIMSQLWLVIIIINICAHQHLHPIITGWDNTGAPLVTCGPTGHMDILLARRADC